MLCILTLGLYFLIQSLIDPQSKEFHTLDKALKSWAPIFEIFQNSSAKLIIHPSETIQLSHNTTENWGSNIKDFPEYTALFFSTYSVLVKNTTNYDILYVKSEMEYNVTVNMTLEIEYMDRLHSSKIDRLVVHSKIRNPVNAKVCKMNGRGYWDIKTQSCYCHYNTVKVCIIVNDSLDIVDWYKNGCDGKGYYIQDMITWRTNNPYTNLSYPIIIEVRGESDPLVFASQNDLIEFSQSSKDYTILGAVLISISTLILSIPFSWLYCQKRKLRYSEMSSEPRYKDSI
ncbi:hypothetical protein SteCoe_407 [Stentor coeruleus]|uniref:Uncharacterized protein n=1 Tax=Stentor coeruleus TaxID=5963 RepID=A0A1R2D441_9CILI|nr:hypothetical protein SteCoe_407 [Stentor coeruleus]